VPDQKTTIVGQFGGTVGETKKYSIRCNETAADIVYTGVRIVFIGSITG
jgi:hypothetical protein